MKAETVGAVHTHTHTHTHTSILVNKTGLVFVRKFQIYYVKLRACHLNLMRFFCGVFPH